LYFNSFEFSVNVSVITSATEVGKVMQSIPVCLYVCVCQHDCCKSNQPMSLKLGGMIGSTSRKKRLSLGGDPVSVADSGSLFHFPQHCRMGN